jgi:putative acetyltransferase
VASVSALASPGLVRAGGGRWSSPPATRAAIDLCAATFAPSEGSEEGERIRTLVTGLLGMAPQEDVVALLGCVVVSRLRYDQADRTVVVLAPVAVRTDRQGEGIGQQLLRYGLEALRGRGVDVVHTYGDPAYYGKVGFGQITEDVASAPLPLSFRTAGWDSR